MARQKKHSGERRSDLQGSAAKPAGIRIIGGAFRGRKLDYSGDLRTRPMKDRVREALFNLLGKSVAGKIVVDLFAGTGALGLEALSRGAAKSLFIERHIPTARVIRDNIRNLAVESVAEVVAGDTFLWAKRLPDLGATPWLVFCSPPYDFYVEKLDEMLQLLDHVVSPAPAGSLFAVEADDRFDFGLLSHSDDWDIRRYPPAVVGIWDK